MLRSPLQEAVFQAALPGQTTEKTDAASLIPDSLRHTPEFPQATAERSSETL